MKNRFELNLKRNLGLLAALAALLSAPAHLAAQPDKRSEASAYENSVVTIEVARKQYEYYQPWTKRTTRAVKVGLVVGDHQILTTADQLFDNTLVRLQKNGRGRWFIGEVAWRDYNSNLALLTTTDADFWKGLKPATLGGNMPEDGTLQILRWREGKLENRKAEFTQFAVREGQLSAVNQVVLEASSEIQGVGWGEPVVANSHVVGLMRAQEGRTCIAIPASMIKSVLAAQKQGKFPGLGYFHFVWQPALNPASLAKHKLTGDPRGVIVISVPGRPDDAEQVVKPHDILLKIDGFDLDIQGDYSDPEFGHLNLENLAVHGKWAGEDVKIKLLRDGKEMDVTYRLPKFAYTNSLVPAATYDQEPEYLIVGGLVFQPLTDSYLSAWGADWKHRAPFRLNHYNEEPPTKERPALVLLSQVLADPYNIGYQDQNGLVLDKVNGQSISRLTDLREALKKPVNGFHVIEFMKGDSLRRIILAAGAAETEASERILQRYGITEASHFEAPTAKN
jgi:S1-C subfamily serine protease